MAKRTIVKKAKGTVAGKQHQQKGTQQGHNTGKDAWKSNREHIDTQAGTGQEGQHPRKGEEFGSTPGEVRGNPGGKRGQAMGGKRGTAAMNQKAKLRGKRDATNAAKK